MQATIPISSLSIGDICKIPSLPNINQLTIINSNSCGTRVKGSETQKENNDSNKTTFFDHTISNNTPVIKIGHDVVSANNSLAANEKIANIGVNKDEVITEPKQDNSIKDKSAIQQNKTNNNMEQDTNTQEVVTSTAVNNTVKAIAQTVETAKEVAKQNTTPNYTKPAGQFSARVFADTNVIPYPVALAFLKTNAKEAGKESKGRGRPTILYTFE